jgi:hypothetical protein
LIPTPAHPEYPANHAVQSGAIVTVLKHFYGENTGSETARRHEPVAKLGRPAGGSRTLGCPLVHHRCCDRARRRDPDVGEGVSVRRYHERPGLLGNPRGQRWSLAECRANPNSGPALRRGREHRRQGTRSAPRGHRARRAPVRSTKAGRASGCSLSRARRVPRSRNPTLTRRPLVPRGCGRLDFD